MLVPDPLVRALESQFDMRSAYAFRRFLVRHKDVRDWVLVSDDNWGQPDFPQDAISFSLMPNTHGTTAMSAVMAKVFPKDFKKSKTIDHRAQGWFRRRGSGFHWCFVLDNNASVFDTPGATRLLIARESVSKTLDYLTETSAPEWLIRTYKQLQQESLSKSFDRKPFSNVMLLSLMYSFVVGVLARERLIDTLEWCPDRGNETNWEDHFLFKLALTNATRWVRGNKRPLAQDSLVFRVVDDTNSDQFDPIIRPADILAGPVASWCHEQNGSVRSDSKYGDVFRGILIGNDNICIIRLKVRTEGWRISQLFFAKR
jgi:hypothetical protein